MIAIDQKFLDQATAELRAEDERRFMQRVRDRARVLQQRARDLQTSDLRDPLERLAELQARHDTLLAEKRRRHQGALAAVEDDELDRLPARISELTKACRMSGLLPRTAA
jgi:hypothetical protein